MLTLNDFSPELIEFEICAMQQYRRGSEVQIPDSSNDTNNRTDLA